LPVRKGRSASIDSNAVLVRLPTIVAANAQMLRRTDFDARQAD